MAAKYTSSFLSLVVFYLAISRATGGNVLMTPVLGHGSHYTVASTIARELTSRGHNVTFLLHDRYEDTIKESDKRLFKFEYYKSNYTMGEFNDIFANMTNAGLRGKYLEFMLTMTFTTNHMERTESECLNILDDVQLLSRLRNGKYNLAIVDSSVHCPIMQFIRCPYVVLHPALSLPSAMLLANRVPFNPSYMPEFATGFNHEMSFFQRLQNVAQSILFGVILSAFSSPVEKVNKQYNMPRASGLFSDAELWLINSNFALDFPRPLLPTFVPVGGITARPAQNLSHEWEDFLQSAGDEGVVLFSMGGYATEIDEDVAAMFAGAFAQIPQKVIWKLNGKPSATVTPNVKVVEWVPQNDLLGHPQIKAFVYHCGMNGVWEAVYHGVPMVAVPLFADQFDNAQRLVSRGMGVEVDIATLTSDELAEAIRTVIKDPSFKINATRVSTLFRDTSRTPPELAADWIEYVIRHGGTKHLRSAALDLNIFQYLLLDIILTLLVVCITLVVFAICSCKLCFRGCSKICGRSKKVKRE